MPNPLAYAERICYSSKRALHFTHEMAVKYKDAPGCFVEAGVAAGAQIIAMAYGAPNQKIFAFDSFDGIPLPSNRDDQMPGISILQPWERIALPDPGKQVLKSSGATVVSVDNFWENMYGAFGTREFASITSVKGWFEETMLNLPFGLNDIALLRLDGDLYNSTFVCLQHLFPKVLTHAVVIIDDYSLLGCREACKEYFELIGYEPNYQYLDGTAFFYK